MEKWVLYALISMFFAGVTSVIAKLGMKDLNSDIALAFRTIIVFIIIIGNAFVFRNAYTALSQTENRNLYFLAISGVTTSLSWIFYYRAMQLGPVSYVASIDKASIAITILLSFLILKEPITPKLILGATFILIGMFVLISK